MFRHIPTVYPARMRLPHALNDFQMRALNVWHRYIRTVTGGRVMGRRVLGMTAVELHVTGRKSGLRRSTMLTAPIHDGDRLVLVASKGGDDRHPEWYLNLLANPDVELTFDGDTRPYRARTATPEEKAEMWPRVVNAYRGYDGYQRRAGRDIPLVICDPR
jgi:deazaflavin-dependent oxidoreductase (nitroreductase family)